LINNFKKEKNIVGSTRWSTIK